METLLSGTPARFNHLIKNLGRHHTDASEKA